MTEKPPDIVGTWVRVLSLRTRLLSWYDRNRRELPWRRDRDPYRVLVSEFMLQQTRVDVVVPYFERWIALWPTLADLASAPLDDVLAAWSGLGYYRRARSLHELARRVVAEHGGVLPRTAAELRALPGIGPYTAAAVASIAFDEPVACVDGNVERVLTRLTCDRRPSSAARRRTVDEIARRLVTGASDDPGFALPPEGLRAGDWNQAMMELGATVCLPGEPSCLACPWGRTCLSLREGLATSIPARAPKKAPVDVTLHTAVVRRDGKVLLVRRAEGKLLSRLWELPTAPDASSLAARVDEILGRPAALPPATSRSFRHTITHRRITVRVHEADLAHPEVRDSDDDVAWVRPEELRRYGISSMTKKALAAPERHA